MFLWVPKWPAEHRIHVIGWSYLWGRGLTVRFGSCQCQQTLNAAAGAPSAFRQRGARGRDVSVILLPSRKVQVQSRRARVPGAGSVVDARHPLVARALPAFPMRFAVLGWPAKRCAGVSFFFARRTNAVSHGRALP